MMAIKELISLSSVVCRSPEHLSTEVDHETVLMSIEQGNYYGLDAIGTDIWKRLEHALPVGELCAELAQQYDASLETINSDVLALLESLVQEGLVEVVA